MAQKTIITLLCLLISVQAYNIPGFAAGTVGGGSAQPQTPRDINELKSWLEDGQARVIHISTLYDFTDMLGSVTGPGCRPASNTCPDKGGQDAIDRYNWCSGDSRNKPMQVTYKKAGTTFIQIGSHKTLLGLGANAVIKGIGLRILGQHVIIRNIHITNLNPKFIWGGDAIYISGGDMIWIDHCKISLIGRQMFVTDGTPANGRITFSNNELDGYTKYSASCNNHHYWTIYITGKYQLTFIGNYIHSTSGRGPKLGEAGVTNNFLAQFINNYWYDTDGHAFDTSNNDGVTLVEGNVFEQVKQTRQHDGNDQAFFPFNNQNVCKGHFNRDCVPNQVINSAQPSENTYQRIGLLKGKPLVNGSQPNFVKANVLSQAGVGKVKD